MVCLVAYVILGSSLSQSQTPVVIDFLPSRDMPSFRNQQGTGAASLGLCPGSDGLTQIYFKFRSRYKVQRLAEAIDTIRQGRGDDYLAAWMNDVTEVAGVRVSSTNRAVKHPQEFSDEIVDRLRKTGEPQSILLFPKDKLAHQISVYGAIPRDGAWEFRVADSEFANDPRFPGEKEADFVTIRYIPGQDSHEGVWQTYVRGQKRGMTYSKGGDLNRQPPDEERMKQVLTLGLNLTDIDEIERTMEVGKYDKKKHSSNTIRLSEGEEVGGVLIQIDPGLLTRKLTEEQLADLSRRAAQFLSDEKSNAQVLRIESRPIQMELVRASSLMPGKTIGRLQRVKGFVVKGDGGVFLAGEPGPNPLQTDDLIVALSSLYRDGSTPFISLDPDPTDYAKDQRVRIGGVQGKLRKSAFVKAMLDADYLMKELSLGVVVPHKPGFKSWMSLFDQSQSFGAVRLWMEPAPPVLADTMMFTSPAGDTAVYFESDVTTLSERALASQNYGAPAGATDPAAEEAAAELSASYNELSSEYPQFRRLQGLFDLAKVSVALRRLKVKSSAIDRLLAMNPATVVIPDTYPGIGPLATPSGKGAVSGGAIAKAEFKGSAAVWTKSLLPMVEKAGKTPQVQIALPLSISIPDARLADHTAAMLLEQAKDTIRSGHPEDGLNLLDRVAKLRPDDEDLRLQRGATLIAMGRIEEGIADLGDTPSRNPKARIVRGIALAEIGRYAEAAKDAEFLENEYALDYLALSTAAIIRMNSMDFAAASRDLGAVRTLAPGAPIIQSIAQQLAAFKKLGSENAKSRMSKVNALPFSVRQRTMAAILNPKEAVDINRGILNDLSSGTIYVDPGLLLKERTQFNLAMALLGSNQIREAGELAANLLAAHPDWPSARLLRALANSVAGADLSTVAPDMKAAFELPADPLLQALRAESDSGDPVLKAAIALVTTGRPTGADVSGVLAWLPKYCPPAEIEFIQSWNSIPSADTALVVRSRGSSGLGKDPHRTSLKLARSIPAGLCPDFPTFIAGMSLVQIAMESADITILEAREMRMKSLGMLEAPSPTNLRDGERLIRSGSYVEVARSMFQQLEHPDDPTVRAFETLASGARRMSQVDLASVKPSEVKAFVHDLATAVTVFWKKSSIGFGAELDAIGPSGTAARDRVEVIATFLWRSVFNQGKDDISALSTRFPYLPSLPEYQDLKATYDKVKGGQFGPTPEPELWARVVVGLKDRQTASDFSGALEMLAQMVPKRDKRLLVHSFQARLVARCLD
jgi:tetratricopeptide (TPR) repeat protein